MWFAAYHHRFKSSNAVSSASWDSFSDNNVNQAILDPTGLGEVALSRKYQRSPDALYPSTAGRA
jgi:hypothetical protein